MRIEIFFEQCSEIENLSFHLESIVQKQLEIDSSLREKVDLLEDNKEEIEKQRALFIKEEERIKKFYWELNDIQIPVTKNHRKKNKSSNEGSYYY